MNRTTIVAVFAVTWLTAMATPSLSATDRSTGTSASQPDMQARIDIDFRGVPLEKAIQFLRDLRQANIVVNWGCLEGVGATKVAGVSLRLRNVSFEMALKQLLATAAGKHGLLGYVIRDGVIKISSRSDLGLDNTPEVYPPPDKALLTMLNNTIVPELNFRGVPLEKNLDFMRDLSKTNIAVDWDALEGLGITKNLEGTLRLRNVSLRVGLSNLLSSAAGREGVLDYAVRDNVIQISSKDALTTPTPSQPAASPGMPSDWTAESAAMEAETMRKLQSLEVDISGLRARLAASKEVVAELKANKASESMLEKIELIRTTAQIDLADLLARKTQMESTLKKWSELRQRAKSAFGGN